VRILIVEDDPFVALDLESIVQDALQGVLQDALQGGAQDAAQADVAVALSVAEARECLAGADFAFLDVDLIDGRVFEVARMLKARRIPFAFVTGAPRGDIPLHLRDAPFIAKPYRVWQIENSLRDATAVRAARSA